MRMPPVRGYKIYYLRRLLMTEFADILGDCDLVVRGPDLAVVRADRRADRPSLVGPGPSQPERKRRQPWAPVEASDFQSAPPSQKIAFVRHLRPAAAATSANPAAARPTSGSASTISKAPPARAAATSTCARWPSEQSEHSGLSVAAPPASSAAWIQVRKAPAGGGTRHSARSAKCGKLLDGRRTGPTTPWKARVGMR